MKIDDDIRFPYPVLGPLTGDYSVGSISFDARVEEKPDTGALSLEYTVDMLPDPMRDIIADGSAQAAVFISCLDTFYNRLHHLDGYTGKLVVPPGELRGSVQLRPVVVSVREIAGYRDASIHPEFGPGPFAFPVGALLACGEELRINVGLDKLASMDTIFELALNKSLPPGNITVDLDKAKITINAAPELYSAVNNLRPRFGRTIILNGVYLPATMQVLSVLQQDSGIGEGMRWHRIFKAKCEHLGIDISTAEPLDAAEILFRQPLGRLVSLWEELSS